MPEPFDWGTITAFSIQLSIRGGSIIGNRDPHYYWKLYIWHLHATLIYPYYSADPGYYLGIFEMFLCFAIYKVDKKNLRLYIFNF